jgi:virginiamycin B lyase
MEGIDRTIARRIFIRLFLGALLAAALAPTIAAAAIKPPGKIAGAKTWTFPERIHGTSVAIAPDGSPWFGVTAQEAGLALGHLQAGKLEVETLQKEGRYGGTEALHFDPQGALWFLHDGEAGAAVARRDPGGAVTEFPLPKGEPVNDLTFGPEGALWFVRGGYAQGAEAQVGRMTPTGEATQWPLEAGAHPTSITAGPDGALWFNEEHLSKIGRITTGGEIQLFGLEPEAHPRQIVAGPEGALWFGESGFPRKYGKVSDRIGRITTDGQVTHFPVPFGTGTTRLAPDPRGVIWFATDAGEVSSIAPSGNVGARGCAGSCNPIEGMTLAPDGSLWFAAGHASCLMCGGGSDLMLENSGTTVGRIPGGALSPADPNGPPAVDPFANQTDNPPPPIVRTEKPEELGATFAVLSGYINSRGYPTTWQFRWGKTKKYNHRSFLPEYPIEAEEGAVEVGEEIFNLCPATTYHYKIIAWGPGGRASGGDRAFTTRRQKHVPGHCRRH